MIDFLHQGQKTAQFAVWKAFSGKPVQILARQVGNDPPLVFAEWHFAGHQQFEFFGVHAAAFRYVMQRMINTGILHAGQLTDHAKKPDTDSYDFYNLLIYKDLFKFSNWHGVCKY